MGADVVYDSARSVGARRWRRASIGAAAALVLALSLSACGGGGSSGAGSAGSESGDSSGASVEDAAVDGRGAESASNRDVSDDSGGFDRKIVKTAKLGLRADDVRASAGRAREIAADHDGNVLSSRTSQREGSVFAELTLSVPSPEFEAALDELRRVGAEVTTDSVEGEDVSEEYVDLESRERNLEAAEESLLDLYDEAEDVEDALEIERELTGVRGEIEQVQGRIGYLEERTSESRITVTIQPATGAETASPDWDPGGVAARAWNASLAVLQGLANGVISAVVFGWWLAPALATGLAVFAWWRRNRETAPTDPDAQETR